VASELDQGYRRLCRTFAERELRGDLALLEQAIGEAA
jgi:hypothetical protein